MKQANIVKIRMKYRGHLSVVAMACWSLVWWWWWWRHDPHLITFRAWHFRYVSCAVQPAARHQPVVAAHFLQIIDLCKDVWTLSILGICPPTSCHKQQMAVFNYFSCFVACRNITKVESDPLKWESHKISRQKKNGTSLMSSAKIPENDYPLALRHLLKRRKIPAFSLQPISPFLGLCDHLTSAVTSVGEVPVSDVNKVWNALKCYNLHPDPCWLATRECRKGRWSEVSFGGQTLLMQHHVGWTIYIIESYFVPSSPPPPSLPAPDRCHLLTHSHF